MKGDPGTLDKVDYIYEEAKALMGAREEDYEDSWEREGLHNMAAAMYRKASGLDIAFRNGNWSKKANKTREDIRDLMNYAALTGHLLELELRKGETDAIGTGKPD